MAVDVETDVKSRCGIDCSECKYMEEKVCMGCIHMEKPFWADACPVKTCSENKEIDCCGRCDEFPCDLLKSFAYDAQQGDNGLRLENCRKWCSKNN